MCNKFVEEDFGCNDSRNRLSNFIKWFDKLGIKAILFDLSGENFFHFDYGDTWVFGK